MKKGFALLETICVIAFISVALLLLYNPFLNMVNNNRKNILYDDVANIYKAYYLKEYISIYDRTALTSNSDFTEISCNSLNVPKCQDLKNSLNISKIYLVKYDLKNYDITDENLKSYLNTLSNKDDYQYRLVLEFKDKNFSSYVNIGLWGE